MSGTRRVATEPRSVVAERIAAATIVGALFITPLFFGGRFAIGHLVCHFLLGLGTFAYLLSALGSESVAWRFSPLHAVGAAALLLGLGQLVPLPPTWRAAIAPGQFDRLADYEYAAGSPWTTLSLEPTAGALALGLLATLLAWHWLLRQRIRSQADVRLVTRGIAAAAVAAAVVALLDLLLGNGRYLGLVHTAQGAGRDAHGSFTNGNHLAHYVALGTPAVAQELFDAIWPADDIDSGLRARALQAGIAACGLLAAVAAVLFAGSRGGAVALSAGLTVWIGTLCLAGRVSWFTAGIAATLTAAAALTTLDLVRPPTSEALADWSDVQGGGGFSRLNIWQAECRAWSDAPWFGHGLGAHRDLIDAYILDPIRVEYTHAENGYLQVLVEGGLVGATLLAAALSWTVFTIWRIFQGSKRPRRTAFLAAPLIAAVGMSLLQSLWDFVWYVPACLIVTLVAAAGLETLADRRERPSPQESLERGQTETDDAAARGTGWTLAGCCLVAAMLAIWHALPIARGDRAWDRYFAAALSRRGELPGVPAADQKPTAVSGEPRLRLAPQQQAMFASLRETLAWNPTHARAHLRTAVLLLEGFDHNAELREHALRASEIREAAESASFPTDSARQAWLATVLEEDARLLARARWHARQAVRSSPYLGRAYVYLAETEFLASGPADGRRRLLAQCLAVRPRDPAAHLQSAALEAQAGRAEAALAHLRTAYAQGRHWQYQIVAAFRPVIPLPALLESLAAQDDSLRGLATSMKRSGDAEGERTVWLTLAQRCQARGKTAAAESRADAAAEHWTAAGDYFRRAGQLDAAAEAYREATSQRPNSWEARKGLAETLWLAQRPQAALVHYQWLMEQRPHDNDLKSRYYHVKRIAARPPGESR